VVVIDATPGGLGDRLSRMRDPSLRGASGGLAARDLFVPLPEVQLGAFIQISEINTPHFFSPLPVYLGCTCRPFRKTIILE
jgi:hypothetical protein